MWEEQSSEIPMDLEDAGWSPDFSNASDDHSWSTYNESETHAWSTTFESSLDNPFSKQLSPAPNSVEQIPKKGRRGRKPLRPQDPVKKKTEEKDKYWLRGFRAYMKSEYQNVKNTFTLDEQMFWEDHLGAGGKPDKGSTFLSYGRKYKDYLFSHETFVTNFQKWFVQHGEAELTKKCRSGSDLWFVFFDYASKELLYYRPIIQLDSPFKTEQSSAGPGDQYTLSDDFEMHIMDEDKFVDLVLDHL